MMKDQERKRINEWRNEHNQLISTSWTTKETSLCSTTPRQPLSNIRWLRGFTPLSWQAPGLASLRQSPSPDLRRWRDCRYFYPTAAHAARQSEPFKDSFCLMLWVVEFSTMQLAVVFVSSSHRKKSGGPHTLCEFAEQDSQLHRLTWVLKAWS